MNMMSRRAGAVCMHGPGIRVVVQFVMNHDSHDRLAYMSSFAQKPNDARNRDELKKMCQKVCTAIACHDACMHESVGWIEISWSRCVMRAPPPQQQPTCQYVRAMHCDNNKVQRHGN